MPTINEDQIYKGDEWRTWPRFHQKVELALNQILPLKSSGLVGFRANFYQQHWSIMEVCNAALDFLNNEVMSPFLYFTYIILLSKVKNLMSITKFRPITLCNFLYKMISNVVRNKIKKVIPIIIFSTQCVFIPIRLITDNIMITYEVLHIMRTKEKEAKEA